jgi:LacI family transcriptional regulator
MTTRRSAPTMMDVAARAGVSHQTVSRVLGDPDKVAPGTRDRVLEAIAQLDYRRNESARALARQRTGMIGVVVAELGLFGPSSTVLGVDHAAREAGMRTLLAAVDKVTRPELLKAVTSVVDRGVEGIVVIAPSQAQVIPALVRTGVPAVVVDGRRGTGAGTVAVDQVGGARRAVEHLVGLGHQRIAHVRGPVGWTQAEQRVEGWRQVLREAHLASGPLIRGDWQPESGYLAGLQVAEDPTITGVFVANDQMAMGMLRALHEKGIRVPGTISVIAFDDLPEAGYTVPPLTTMRQDFAGLGRAAVTAVMAAIQAREDGTAIEEFDWTAVAAAAPPLTPDLVLRSTTGPAPVR